jgi:RNAse (barnase) inhibitor barstar
MQIFKHNIIVNQVFIAFLDGQKCTELSHFYTEISKSLNFPSYFHPNLDSLDECINNLSWIFEKEIILLIFNADNFLKKESYHKEIINSIFENAIIEFKNKKNSFSIAFQVE